MTDIFQELQDMMPASEKVFERNTRVLAQEVVGTILLPYKFYAAEAKGSRVTDADGNEFIDLTMGFGPLLLGHNPDVAVEAARAAVEKAMLLGIPNPYQGELAELLVDAAPCAEQVVFCNTGTEATMYAIRLARALTGKTRIAMFDGSYHGAHDYVIMEGVLEPDPSQPSHRPQGHGVPNATTEQILFLPYRDPRAFELIESNKDELACVLLEPVQSSNPRLDVGPYLRELREVCTRNGVLLILDEVITGFRLGYGGGQERFDVTPDLATYGKILGGGMPIGAVAGPRELMKPFNFFGEDNPIFSGGTFGGNPVSMLTGAAVVRHLHDNPEIYPDLRRKGDRLTEGVNQFLQQGDYPAQLLHADSMFHLMFTRESVERGRHFDESTMMLENRYYAHLMKRGVVVPGIHLFFISAAHSDADVDLVVDAMCDSFRALRSEGHV
ncbi:MAG: aminotransferase class III-fold pyridoxal phosphate-dependent enzyme [Pseudomonadales bacterium]|jgi:glutamate-1-semialdehyde 2,1-aminomutase|nr:aminotransferase class III-fold pyridoxal phosphate-dependent enzyme [Pseudomonadales bacterium]MDP6471237.1 aminotransferase class III-fold pyridoxal phosphate-dependent enzyme [Pseudomonadales bacterium]MDP6825574.1 aminotransferase class III-fold pyridoxal phosphate-dependent enzyme [Pseudomonadales bacterium]MDP6972941.1 aminotransferase class III-fold pyridoxal phosphate-dependent enzyme [Pseudomonadales bacterium]|tara:strand:+ start:2712 stop:4034 length:1323 start_codon:yes stop_codon:yes gene_type:complete